MLREDTDRRRVVGTVCQVQGLRLWHQAEEAAPDPLLGLWHLGASSKDCTSICWGKKKKNIFLLDFPLNMKCLLNLTSHWSAEAVGRLKAV